MRCERAMRESREERKRSWAADFGSMIHCRKPLLPLIDADSLCGGAVGEPLAGSVAEVDAVAGFEVGVDFVF